MKWFYDKYSFLQMLTASICDTVTQQTAAWKVFLLDMYEVQATTKAAYESHLAEENSSALLKLKELESQRASDDHSKFEKLYRKKFAKEGTKRKLHFLVMLEDIHTVLTDSDSQFKYSRFMKTIRDECALRDDYNKRESFIALKDYQKGLTDLGPFGVAPCKNPKQFFRAVTEPGNHPNGEPYYGYLELHHEPTRQQFYNIFGFSWYKMNFSRLTPMSVSQHTADKLHVPLSAAQFAWVFPNINDTLVEQVKDPERKRKIDNYKKGEDAITCIMATGGFAYFDKNGEFLAVNGIFLFGDDMFFDGPYAFPEHKLVEYFENLGDDSNPNTMQEVTVPFLRNVFGCDKFGWIAQDEELGINNGAFYYLYREEDNKAPNYFKFLDFEQAKLSKLKNNNTPGIQYLGMLFKRFKDEWGMEDKIEVRRANLSTADPTEFE